MSVIDEMVTGVPVDQADCFMPFINMHLRRHREGCVCMASAALVDDDELDRMVHSFFETHTMVCPCMHPYFDRCVQLITHVANAGTSISEPPPRRVVAKEDPPTGFSPSISAGIMGCMLARAARGLKACPRYGVVGAAGRALCPACDHTLHLSPAGATHSRTVVEEHSRWELRYVDWTVSPPQFGHFLGRPLGLYSDVKSQSGDLICRECSTSSGAEADA